MCDGENTRNITNKSDCLLAKHKWVRHKYNFDNLGQVSPIHTFFKFINLPCFQQSKNGVVI